MEVMLAKIIVEYSFTNKKGIRKKVKFPMDKKSYEVYQDKRLTPEWRDKMMLLEYKDYCDERNYKKRCSLLISFDNCLLDEESSSNNLDELDKEMQKQYLRFLISKLTKLQKEIITKLYYEEKRPGQVAKEINTSIYAVSMVSKRAILSLKRLNNEENYKKFLNTR